MKRNFRMAIIAAIILIIPSIIYVSGDDTNGNSSEYSSNNVKMSGPRGSISDESINSPIWPMYQYDQQRSGRSPFNATGNPGRVKEVIDSVIIGSTISGKTWTLMDEDKNMYCIDNQNNLTCYNSNFTIKWRISIEDIEKTPIYNNHVLYVMKTKEVFAIDCETGSILWVNRTTTSLYLLYYLNIEKTMINIVEKSYSDHFIKRYYLNGTLKEINRIEMPDENHSFNPNIVPAVGSNDLVYLSYQNYSDWSYGICSIYPNGTLKWIKSDHWWWGYPILDGEENIYYVSQYLSSYYSNGTLKWKIQVADTYANAPPSLSPDGTIIVPGDKIYSIYPNGTLKWIKDYTMDSESIIVDSDGNIIFSGTIPNNDNSYMMMLNHSGSLKWKNQISNPYQTPIIMPNGEIHISNRYKDTSKFVLHILGRTEPESPLIKSAISGDSFINLSWNPPDHNGGEIIQEYRFYRKDSSLEPYVLKYTVDPNDRWFNDTTVSNGNTYSYRLTAVNSIGQSDRSNTVSATPLSIPSPPTNLTADYGDNFVFLEWDKPLDDGGTDISKLILYKGDNLDSMSILINLTPTRNNFNDTEVIPGETYYYRMSSVNSEGESILSDHVSGVPRTLPNSPLNFSVFAGDGFIDISWSPPAFNGGSPILNYTLYKGIYTEGYNYPSIILEPGTTGYNDTNVENGIHYIYSLKTSTVIGDSPRTSEQMATPIGYPSPPRNFICSSNDGYIDLIWDYPEDDGGSTIIGYQLELTNGSEMEYFNIDGMLSSIIINNLLNGNQYSLRIRSMNSVGFSSFTGSIECTPMGVPSAPVDFSCDIGRYYVILKWSESDYNGGSNIHSYRIYRNGSILDNISSSIFNFNDTNVFPGMAYHYSISSINSIGESIKTDEIYVTIPEVPEVKTEIPSAPRNISFEIVNLSVIISWIEPESDGNSRILRYDIYRTYQDNEVLIGSSQSDTFSYQDDNIITGGHYQYRVTARNGVGEGPSSDQITVEIIQEINDDEDKRSNAIWFIIIPISLIIVIFLIISVLIVMKKREKIPFPDQEIGQDQELGSESDQINQF